MRKRRSIEIPPVREAVHLYLAQRAGQAISPKTLRFEECTLIPLVKAFGNQLVTEITKADLEAFVQERREAGNSVNTIKHILVVARRWFIYLIEQGLAKDNPAARVPLPRAEQKPIQPMTPEQVQRLLDTFDTTRFSGVRNRVVTMLLYDTGLRVGEALGIRLVDMELASRRIHVIGKGRRPRTVYISETMTATLRTYLQRRGNLEGNPWLFADEYGQGELEYSSYQHALYRANKVAKIEGVRVSAHSLRHSFAREWTVAGGDVASLSAQLGHSTLEMTTRYVHLLGDDRAAIQQRVSPLERLGGATTKKKRL